MSMQEEVLSAQHAKAEREQRGALRGYEFYVHGDEGDQYLSILRTDQAERQRQLIEERDALKKASTQFDMSSACEQLCCCSNYMLCIHTCLIH